MRTFNDCGDCTLCEDSIKLWREKGIYEPVHCTNLDKHLYSGDTLKMPTEIKMVTNELLKTIKPPYYLLYDYTTDNKAIIKL